MIHKDNPKADEVRAWMKIGGLELRKFFNTNGKMFKEKNLKELWESFTEDDLLQILESDGMLHKRPVLVSENYVLTGFKVKEWEEAFNL